MGFITYFNIMKGKQGRTMVIGAVFDRQMLSPVG